MSRPYALPVGPTRLADSSTSMPPPDPRSRTVSPGFSSTSAVGLPHPSDAATASRGSALVSASEYRSDVIGSPPPQGVGPQQPFVVDALDALLTALAMAPYFSRTAWCTSDMPCLQCICKNEYTQTIGRRDIFVNTDIWRSHG